MSGLLHESEVLLANHGEGVFLAVQADLTIALAVGTPFRATRVTMTEQDFRELINKCREALHFLASKKGT